MGAQIQSHSLSTLALCNLSEIMKFFHLKGATLKWMAFAWYCAHRGARGIGMVRGRERERELVLTCRSVRSRLAAISILLGRHKYLLKWNSFSSSSSCVLVYAVRRRRGRPFSGTNSAAIENCISCLSLAVNVNLDVAPPHTRLAASSAVDKLHSLGFDFK